MIYQPKNPIGYRKLLTWRQDGEIYHRTKDFTNVYLDKIKDSRLLNHMNDSGRSVQRNIEEGFKRATTKEYIEFLGFSRGSLEELKGDFEELKREYKEGIRRVNKGREGIEKEIEELLGLIYGEDCMMGRQIISLERKMVNEKTLPQKEIIKREMDTSKKANELFWKNVKDGFGLERNEKGIFIKKK
ncbi:MAG: hypothetical protein A2539_02550 [Elusimicrobia bacterium RIFOXYD2_FULL_34_15]|nr:MAG: hypothetical protein A2539_02550 [Elusimicrobia bacterium RIFOXYD2_FULL_34_15]